MENKPEKEPDGSCLYTVLGVGRSSSSSEIRSAYRKLAMKWHPDKCTTTTSFAKSKFQGIQEAYTVLSDDKKRVLYDSGLYDEGDDEGTQSFMSEMVSMMNTNYKSTVNELKSMFEAMVDTYPPESSNYCGIFSDQASSSSSCSNSASLFADPGQNFFGDFSSQNFCIGRQDTGESIAKHRSHKKPAVPRRRKSQT